MADHKLAYAEFKEYLTQLYLRGLPESVIWIYDTFEDNLEIENGFIFNI